MPKISKISLDKDNQYFKSRVSSDVISSLLTVHVLPLSGGNLNLAKKRTKPNNTQQLITIDLFRAISANTTALCLLYFFVYQIYYKLN